MRAIVDGKGVLEINIATDGMEESLTLYVEEINAEGDVLMV